MRRPARAIAVGVGVVLVGLAVVLATQVSSDPRSEALASRLIGERVPAFTLEDLAGDIVSRESLEGRSVIVNFWNTWCIPCEQELPALQAFHEQHAGDPDFVMLGIVRDDSEGVVRAFVSSRGIGWTVAMDPGSRAALAFGTRGQPETFAIDTSGRVVASNIGPSRVRDLEVMLAAARR